MSIFPGHGKRNSLHAVCEQTVTPMTAENMRPSAFGTKWDGQNHIACIQNRPSFNIWSWVITHSRLLLYPRKIGHSFHDIFHIKNWHAAVPGRRGVEIKCRNMAGSSRTAKLWPGVLTALTYWQYMVCPQYKNTEIKGSFIVFNEQCRECEQWKQFCGTCEIPYVMYRAILISGYAHFQFINKHKIVYQPSVSPLILVGDPGEPGAHPRWPMGAVSERSPEWVALNCIVI